jgi:hypothetical protein
MKKFLKTHWRVALFSLAAVSFLCNVLAFYPGYMSMDSLNQYYQTIGVNPISDLTPPAMTMVWKVLMHLTGHSASLMIFQQLLFWMAITLLSLYILRTTKSRKLSLMPFAIGILPFVLNISGVIWKDNQMTFSLLLAVTLTLSFKWTRDRRWRIALTATSLLLITYACLVRYNAVPAVIPVLFLVVHQSGFIRRIRWELAVTLVLTLGILALYPAVNKIMHARQSHPVSGVMLDDMANLASAQELHAASAPAPLKRSLIKAQHCAQQRNLLINSFYYCANSNDQHNVQYGYYDQLQGLWIKTVIHQPLEYGLYKVQTFLVFFFPPEGFAYVWQDGIVPNNHGLEVASPRMKGIMNSYVNDFGYRHFSTLFEPWFWFVSGIALIIYAQRKIRENKLFVIILVASGMLYTLSFMPSGASGDYRYIYWPVLATIFGGIVAFTERKAAKK